MKFKDGIAPLFEEVFGHNQVSNICNKKTKIDQWIWRKRDSIDNSDIKFLAWENDFCRNSILMTCHYPDLDSASDWSSIVWGKICFNQSEATNRQYGISVTVSQTTFRGETSGCIVKCRLFSPAIKFQATSAIYFLKKDASSEWENWHWGEVNDFYF